MPATDLLAQRREQMATAALGGRDDQYPAAKLTAGAGLAGSSPRAGHLRGQFAAARAGMRSRRCIWIMVVVCILRISFVLRSPLRACVGDMEGIRQLNPEDFQRREGGGVLGADASEAA